jgi:hypothetical protein
VQAQDNPTLCDRLGGVYSIATVVDDFIDRIMVGPSLNVKPSVYEAHQSCFAAWLQVPGHRNGLLGNWRAAAVQRSFHERFARASFLDDL